MPEKRTLCFLELLSKITYLYFCTSVLTSVDLPIFNLIKALKSCAILLNLSSAGSIYSAHLAMIFLNREGRIFSTTDT